MFSSHRTRGPWQVLAAVAEISVMQGTVRQKLEELHMKKRSIYGQQSQELLRIYEEADPKEHRFELVCERVPSRLIFPRRDN